MSELWNPEDRPMRREDFWREDDEDDEPEAYRNSVSNWAFTLAYAAFMLQFNVVELARFAKEKWLK